MNNKIILTNELLISRGQERACYIHPNDNSKVIKIVFIEGKTRNQNELEYEYYEYLNNKNIPEIYITKCYGYINTNLGKGLVFDKICDYNGNISLSFSEIIKKNLIDEETERSLLEELKNYLFKYNILFIDVALCNILCCEYQKEKYKLIIVDGLGGRRTGWKFNLYLKSIIFTKYKVSKQWLKVNINYEDIIKERNKEEPFIWDNYSDQPQVIKDKAYKKAMRKKHLKDFIKLIFTSLFVLPLSAILMKVFKGKVETSNINFVGLGVNLDKDDGQNIQQELVEELGVKNLIIRVPLWDIENIDLYVQFAQSFNKTSKKDILLNIIQDRQNIENKELLKQNLELIFTKFENISNKFQIGTTINRMKWGFFSVKEYIDFYKIAQDLKEQKYPDIKLLGPSVIDFEYYYNVRAMFNLQNIKYDITSALLYVDRRGSAKNTQYLIFDLKNKIDLLFSLVKLSPKCKSDEIYITETNWPISNTAPYAPTSQKECVSNEEYTKYMLEYFEIAKKSKKIRRVYWHQLIAPGYGLVDNRDGKIVKYPQFYAFKELIKK